MGSSGDSVPAGEESFLRALVNEFESYPNIIWVMAGIPIRQTLH